MSSPTDADSPPRFFTLPNLITLTSLNLGALAILAALVDGGPAGVKRAAILVLCGAVCDFLDGRVARATGQQSPLGAQLDSFADFVTFGLAPAAILYEAGLSGLGLLGLAACAVYATGTALRLARFNVKSASGPQMHFEGLPSSAAAVTVAAIALASPDGLPALAVVLAPAIGFAMISAVRFPTFKLGIPRGAALAVSATLLAIAFVAGPALALVSGLVAYLCLGVRDSAPRALAELRDFASQARKSSATARDR